MTPARRALAAVLGFAIGWSFMAAAYDKPEWYFQVLGILGVVLVVISLVWWGISAYRAKSATTQANSLPRSSDDA